MTTQIINISITHPTLPDGLITGFRFFWAYYVKGYRPDRHCQPCFKGKLAEGLRTGGARSGCSYALDNVDRYDYVYVCGVGSGPKPSLAAKNFHLPLKYMAGAVVTQSTYNGYVITAENAIAVPIPPLEDGWNGRDRETTRCKNFQFAVAYFGHK